MAGVVMAHLLADDFNITILEAEESLGGLCGTSMFYGFPCDIGPHIIFSKNPAALEFLTKLGGDLLTTFERSNQILYKGQLIRYPFENFLGLLPEAEREECVRTFIHNPYEDYAPGNMLQFFLKNFGPGITNTYLRPYNEKIWKFDPAFMDTQMVGRIPKPPAEDIIAGAEGNPREGYTHQAKFFYPRRGGMQALFDRIVVQLPISVKKLTGARVCRLSRRAPAGWRVETSAAGTHDFDQIVNCLPLHNLFPCLDWAVPPEISATLSQLKYNSLRYGIALFRKDTAGANFSLNIPERRIIFHRVSKLNFITPDAPPDLSAFLYEVTYRENSDLAALCDAAFQERVIDGFEQSGLARREDLVDFMAKRAKFAYVIYDLHHRKNTDAVLAYLRETGILSCGRFAEFEYLNTDHVVERAFRRAEEVRSLAGIVPAP